MVEISQSLFSAAATLLLFVLPFSWLLLHLRSASPGRKSTIPSPPGLPIIGHLHLLKKKPLHRSLAELARRYDGGGTGLLRLRFGSHPVLLVSSPAVADECFTVHDVALADRPGLASRRLLTDDCPSISTASYGPLWRRLRRLATVHALCAHRLGDTAAARDAEARAMAAKLWRRAGAGTGAGAVVVSVKATAYEFVVNVIMSMVSGERMPEEKVLQFKEMTEAGFAAAGAANRQDFLPVLRLLDLFGKTRKRLAGIAKARHQFGQSLVDEYRRRHHLRNHDDDQETPRTVIGDLLREQERSPESHDDVVIRTVCLSLLQAGTDTSSCTIEWAMALLLNNPAVLRKMTAEIDSVVGTSRLLQESDLANLPYLQCIITETLRLYPLTPHLVPHEAARDIVVAGHVVPQGTMVLVDVYSMQRDPGMWDDPEKFVPERFMGMDKNRGWMMPFGMGRRKCPGDSLALRTVGMALGVLIQCFQWDRVAEEEVDMSEGSGLTMPMAVPLVAICRPRVEMSIILKTL